MPPSPVSVAQPSVSATLQGRNAARKSRRGKPPGWAVAVVSFSHKTKEFIARKLPGNLMARKRELGTAGISLLLHLVVLLLFSIWLLPGGAADEVLRLFSAAPEEPPPENVEELVEVVQPDSLEDLNVNSTM